MMSALFSNKKLTVYFCLFLIGIHTLLPLSNVSAQGKTDTYFFSGNDILNWDPDEMDQRCNIPIATAGSSGAAILTGNSNEEKVWNFFAQKGFTAEQVAGIMGNIKAESGFNPGIEERTVNPNKGYGIAQWTGPRRTALEAAAAAQGVSSSDLLFQLNYLYDEMSVRRPNPRFPRYSSFPNEVVALQAQSTVNDALIAFHHNFERSHLLNSANPDQAVINARGTFAQDFFNLYSSGGGGSGGGGGGGSGWSSSSSLLSATNCIPVAGASGAAGGALINTGSGSVSDFQALVLAYAWENWRGFGYTDAKQAYKDAITKAKLEGRYIGGCNGVDCGAFITTLMVNSGWEPNYNHGGLLSSGAGATTVQRSWVEANWTSLGSGVNPASLQPGDVAFYPGHTFVFVGSIPGFESNIAGSSLCSYAPMAAISDISASNTTWFRRK